ncbi:hypothetical protein ACN08N_23685 [Photobacterium leiognathi subsp. mandapamensis]|uniref:hypothetical protein n=1 Tax=Photobacterium leiognathi TaxID=553611 RepID=UPI003AF340E7
MDPLFKTLLDVYGSELAVAKAFGCSRAPHWKDKVPERIALLSHLSPKIPYTYNPSDYNVDVKALGIKIKQKKVTTNDPVNRVPEQNIKHYRRAS